MKKTYLFIILTFFWGWAIQAQNDISEEQRLLDGCRTEGHQEMRKLVAQEKRGGPTDETVRQRIIDSLYQAGALYKSQQIQLRGVLGAGDTIPAPDSMGTIHRFANGKLRGYWEIKKITNNQDGVRLDRTVYDSTSNRIYALNTVGNLMDGLMQVNGILERRNQKVIVEEQGFAGVILPNGKFRLIGAINNGWTNGALRYSDDHGMTWIESGGGEYTEKRVYWTHVLANKHILSRVSRKINGVDNHLIIRSTDFGVSYSVVKAWTEATSNRFTSARMYNTGDSCIVVRKVIGQNLWEIYRYQGDTLALFSTLQTEKLPRTMTGTFHGGSIKFYIGVDGEGGFYSPNGGLTFRWIATLNKDLETVVPNNPNFLMSREPQHDYSTDGGLTWQKYPNNNGTVGWDPKHVTYYQRKGGAWVFTVANDMGFSYNDNADPLSNNWRYVNNEHTYAILHGGFTDDYTGLTVTCHQDPGTFEQRVTTEDKLFATKQQGADGLRAAFSKGGKAYWFRHYWDQFFHRHDMRSGDFREVTTNAGAPQDWYTPPFVGSTNLNEDAIYVSGYAKLRKFIYNTSNNTITKTDLPFDFQAQAGDITLGVGVARSDSARIYVATRNKRFFTSRDGGRTWEETLYNGTKPNPNTPAYNQSSGFYIRVSDQNPDLVFWGSQTGAGACLRSTDGGRTFTTFMNGLPNNEAVRDISLSPDGQLAFSSNFYFYLPSDNRWYEMKGTSLPEGINVKSVNFLPSQNKVRFFTWGAGILDFNITHLEGLTTSNKDLTDLSPLFNLSPNPATEQVQLHFADMKEAFSVTVFDLTGRPIFSQKMAQQGFGSLTIPTASWGAGVYLVRVQSPSQVGIKRFVKQ